MASRVWNQPTLNLKLRVENREFPKVKLRFSYQNKKGGMLGRPEPRLPGMGSCESYLTNRT